MFSLMLFKISGSSEHLVRVLTSFRIICPVYRYLELTFGDTVRYKIYSDAGRKINACEIPSCCDGLLQHNISAKYQAVPERR